MKIIYVTRTYEVRLPDDLSDVHAGIDDKMDPEDGAIVKSSENATAMFLSYQYDDGNFRDIVDILDVTVSDVPSDVEEFELNDE